MCINKRPNGTLHVQLTFRETDGLVYTYLHDLFTLNGSVKVITNDGRELSFDAAGLDIGKKVKSILSDGIEKEARKELIA